MDHQALVPEDNRFFICWAVGSSIIDGKEMNLKTGKHNRISVSVIVPRDRLQWKSVAFLLEGLTGQLLLGDIFVAPPERGQIGSRLVAGLIALETKVFGRLWVTAAPATIKNLPDDSEEIETCDVLVDFRDVPSNASLISRARYGVWKCTCHEGYQVANAVISGSSALKTCVYRNSPTLPGESQLASIVVQTKRAIAPSIAFASEKSVQLLLRELRRLVTTGQVHDLGPLPDRAGRAKLAGLTGYAGRVLGQAMEKLIARIQPTRRDRNGFVLRTGPGQLPHIDPTAGINIPSPENTFCADPFLLEHDGEVYCFYEEYPYDTRRGFIAVARLTEYGAEKIGAALTADHHLSYPFVFRSGDDIFMMPETIQANRLEVWRCTEFPLKWELHATAFQDRPLADPVLFQQGDHWWLFGNSSNDSFGDFSSELCLFKTDGPNLTSIEPHPLNPVVVGSDIARNGGRVFSFDNRLYRFSQDNSGAIYGYGLNLMEITEISETGYEERRVSHFTPDQIPGAVGCHHGDAIAGKFIVDVRTI